MALLGKYELANERFPDCINRHRLEFPDVGVLESAATQLAQSAFPQPAALRFLRQVCRWGGYYGIAERVRMNNQPEAIRQAFIGARNQLADGNVVCALGHVNALHGLGRLSFASKFLRFLAPAKAPILDRIISTETGFPLSAIGYGQLIQACHRAAAELSAAGIINPVRPNGVWFVADIEAAFYADMEHFEA